MHDLHALLQILLHFDPYLLQFLREYGAWVYALLFLILFAETGLVIMPILPGDSMLFVCGTLAGVGAMSLPWLLVLLVTAAVLGDAVNYGVGKRWGVHLFGGKLLNIHHLETTQRFYARHGGKTVVIARLLPIIRTFAPFVAGIAAMPYRRFFVFNLSGAVLWVGGLLGAGYFLGRFPWVKTHLNLVLIAIIVISLLPAGFAWLQQRMQPVSHPAP
ncbi:hypothetical protein B1757_08805 [Acidithiobacillus marinus]|uniref:VTT domain-containing protein n=1 Tax=Acidithiobacillus marinus TaxID=187490 RepID=A0A2I1DLB0_9PROT|nr:VTT domain-containing protein [Acidithiobacillus marinus]PKY10667.1 hypothetical protein B1757_08805 [Acidithiobacillus marinus]